MYKAKAYASEGSASPLASTKISRRDPTDQDVQIEILLGHMGVKFAHALGAHVVVFSTSPKKKDDALRLGADEVVISKNADEMQKHAGSFDFILDAVSADHDINAYISLLRRDGNITLVGAPEKPLAIPAFGLIMGRRSLSRLSYRRHPGNARDARLLREEQHHIRCRGYSDAESQRSL